jgi:hypothetical protein
LHRQASSAEVSEAINASLVSKGNQSHPGALSLSVNLISSKADGSDEAGCFKSFLLHNQSSFPHDGEWLGDKDSLEPQICEATGIVVWVIQGCLFLNLAWMANRDTAIETLVKLLLEGETDVELKGVDDRTSLSLAAGGGHEAVVRLLVDTGRPTST